MQDNLLIGSFDLIIRDSMVIDISFKTKKYFEKYTNEFSMKL